MTVSELFHHEHLFVGCLAIRRVPHRHAGQRLSAGQSSHLLSATDAAELSTLEARLLLSEPSDAASGSRFQLSTQGFDYPSLGVCPALQPDGRCGIHDDGKPSTCGTVPLDPFWPDRLQHVVLASRDGPGFVAADCIAPGLRESHAPLVDSFAIVDAGYHGRMTQQRAALDLEKAIWGDAVFALLRPELGTPSAAARRVPLQGYLSLPMTPAVEVLAARSERCKQRCMRYLDAQIALIDAKVDQALRRRSPEDRPMTAELRRYGQACRALGNVLRRDSTAGPAARPAGGPTASDVEAYLGIGPEPTSQGRP